MQNYSFQQGLWSVPPKRDMTRSLLLIPAEQIVPNPNQPRRIFDEEKLKELMISIAHPDDREMLDRQAFERFGPHYHNFSI